MKIYIDILNGIESLNSSASTIEESWGFFNLSGKSEIDCCLKILQLDNTLKTAGCDSALTVRIDNSEVAKEELEDYNNNPRSFSTWKIVINKQAILAKKLEKNFATNFFFQSKSCQSWLSKLDPLDEKCPFNQSSPLKIIVKDLDVPFGGEHLYFLPAEERFFSLVYNNPIELPNIEKVKEQVHFITNYTINFNPNTYVITNGDYSSELAKTLLTQASLLLASCVVDEYYSRDRIVINGLKLTELKLFDATEDVCDYTAYKNLVDLVSWIYEDRSSTRRKLFFDRLTLECRLDDSYVKSLKLHLPQALIQAKDRYNFVILDRKDAYVKELKELLKDLRGQSDLYATKIRTLLSNFLRDVLAGIILVGFTIFTKFTDNIGLDKNKLLEYVFYGLATYYFVSIIMQAVVDWVDIGVTNRELKYWKKASKELIAENEFNKHLKDSLGPRRISLFILYPLVGVLYLFLGIACLNYPGIFQTLILKN